MLKVGADDTEQDVELAGCRVALHHFGSSGDRRRAAVEFGGALALKLDRDNDRNRLPDRRMVDCRTVGADYPALLNLRIQRRQGEGDSLTRSASAAMVIHLSSYSARNLVRSMSISSSLADFIARYLERVPAWPMLAG